MGFAWNLLYGVMVTAVLAVAAVATGGAALFVGAAVAAGVTTLFITATDARTGNVRSHDQAKWDIGVAAIIGAVTGGMGGFLKGVEILANPFADMAIKEVIESCVATKAGIVLRSLEAIGLPPEERLAYIYDWKTLALDFGLGTLIGIGLGSAGIAFRGAAGEAVERAVKEGMEDTLEGAVNKGDINVKDLAALTVKTGDEFAMFTRGSQRMIIRGNSRAVNIYGSII